ncbi:MAG: iron-sulfur cluster repair di-iron protein [Acidobacteria bacterium]|nr:iron-sulfur cluster repair di-iron protein [Acidobacteriota bacterium]
MRATPIAAVLFWLPAALAVAAPKEVPPVSTVTRSTFDSQDSVGSIVAASPSRARVFERFGIDYCCGGKRTLAEAAREKGIAVGELADALAAIDARAAGAPDPHDVGSLPPSLLADHLVGTHHVVLRTEMPRLSALLERVLAAHGENHPEYFALAEVWKGFVDEMYAHLVKEEMGLFPAVKREGSEVAEVRGAIDVLEREHDAAGAALVRMRSLTGGYAAPPDACNTLRALLSGLAELERDIHQHVHEENNVLFPAVLARLG